jgi:hypothetical protein
MLIRKIRTKKGQSADFIVLIAVIVGLILFAPIMVRIIGIVTGTFFTQMNSTAPTAVAPASKAVDTVYNFFDYLIVIGMFINIILLFISAWFIDTNPIFIILYIMFAFILFLLLPATMDAVDQVWEKIEGINTLDTWGDSSLNLNFTDFIRRNMMVFCIIIIVMTGVITYAKFKLTQGQFQ